MNNGDVALRNLNSTTQKLKSWIDRWYYQGGVLECRDCEQSIKDRWGCVLHNGKILHVGCLELKWR